MGILNKIRGLGWNTYKKVVAGIYIVLTAAIVLVFGWQFGLIVVAVAGIDALAVYIRNKKKGIW